MRARPRSATQDSGPSPAAERRGGGARNDAEYPCGISRSSAPRLRRRSAAGRRERGLHPPVADAKQLALELMVDPGAGMVLGDPLRLQQVVSNLLSNAVKFTPAGGRIELRLASGGPHVELTVTDTGKGIAPEFMPDLFQRFRQADSSARRVHGGLGIGLAIVRTLVELHGGSVQAASRGQGQGATFTVRLPVFEGQPDLGAGQRTRDALAERADLHGLHVLIVEDDLDTRSLLAEVVEVVLDDRSEEHTSELQSPCNLVCRLLLEKKKNQQLVRPLRARTTALPPRTHVDLGD